MLGDDSLAMTLFELVREQRHNSLRQLDEVERAAVAEVRAGDVRALSIIFQCLVEKKRLRAAQMVDDETEEIVSTPMLSEVEN